MFVGVCACARAYVYLCVHVCVSVLVSECVCVWRMMCMFPSQRDTCTLVVIHCDNDVLCPRIHKPL